MRELLLWLSKWAPLIWTLLSVISLFRIAWIGQKLFNAHRKMLVVAEGPTHQSRQIRRVGMLYAVMAVFLVALIYVGLDPLIRPGSPGLIPAFITLIVLLLCPPMFLFVAEWVWRVHTRD